MRLLLLLLVAAPAWADTCGYDGKDFWVKARGKVQTKTVAANFSYASVRCGPSLSALYDGDELTVFVARTQRFESYNLNNGFSRAVVAVSNGAAGVYDGDSIVVFDARKGAFTQVKGAPGFAFAQFSSGPGRLAFYDGESFLIYDETKGDFVKEKAAKRAPNTRLDSGERLTVFYDRSTFFVYDAGRGQMESAPVASTNFSTIVLGRRDALFYDGKKLLGYCGIARGFATLPVGFDPFSRGFQDKATEQLGIQVFAQRFRLNPGRCEITKGSFGSPRFQG